MAIHPKLKLNLLKIIPFSIIWGLFGVLYAIIEYSVLGGSDVYPFTSNPYNFSTVFPLITTSCLIMGFFFGSLEILFFKKLFRNKSFLQKIIFKTLITVVFLLILLLVLASFIKSSSLNLSIFDSEVFASVLNFASRSAFWIIVIYGAVITILSLFINEVSNYLGNVVFNNFFTGKYHTPKVEERIFMFLDMKSSTTIAEKLGHVRFFELLNKYYGDTTYAIIKTHGEVYQYAGDEIIVSWSLKNGLRDNNCVRCFYLMKESFNRQAESYNELFGFVPEFKAGIHYGKVTTGEIGDLKKEIFFTGDVMNTTARIQSNCNKYETDILISEDLILRLEEDDFFSSTPIGECELKGRQKTINLFSISEKK